MKAKFRVGQVVTPKHGGTGCNSRYVRITKIKLDFACRGRVFVCWTVGKAEYGAPAADLRALTARERGAARARS